MRKSTLTLACLAIIALFASCKKTVEPTITLVQGEGYLTENAEIYNGRTYTIGYVLTGEKLTSIEATLALDGTFVGTYSLAIDELDTYTATFPISSDDPGTLTITGVVTDAKGHTASTSITVNCIERPNAKFVGNYEGNALITGTLNVVPNNMDPMQQEIQDEPVPVQLSIASGENVDDVVGFLTINGQEHLFPINGVVEGNRVSFEAVDDTFTMNYELQGFSVPITLDVTYNISGTLNDGVLELEGTCKGSGDFSVFIVSGTIEMEGVVGGSLTKIE